MKHLFLPSVLPFFFTLQIFAQSIVVNPDGTHSHGIDSGLSTLIINSDGTHSVGINHGPGTIVHNPDRAQPVGINQKREFSHFDSNYALPTSFLREILFYINEDLLYTESSNNCDEELFKLKIHRLNKVIDNKEYKILKRRTLKMPVDESFDMANQLYDLHTLLTLSIIDIETYSLRKQDLIYK